MTEHFSNHQNMIAAWEGFTLPPGERSPRQRFDRAIEEVTELDKAITEHNGTKEADTHIAEESVDVIIRMLGIIAQVGGNADHLLTTKVLDIYAKYPPIPIKKRLDAGETYPAVMKDHKTLWQQTRKK